MCDDGLGFSDSLVYFTKRFFKFNDVCLLSFGSSMCRSIETDHAKPFACEGFNKLPELCSPPSPAVSEQDNRPFSPRITLQTFSGNGDVEFFSMFFNQLFFFGHLVIEWCEKYFDEVTMGKEW